MPYMGVPAFCDSCGAYFTSAFATGRNITFTNCGAQCPRCGRMARIPDGTYDLIGDTIRLLSGPAGTVAHLQRLQEIVRALQARAMTPEAAQDAVERDVPQFASMFAWLREHHTDLAAWIQVVLAVIGILIAARDCGSSKSDGGAAKVDVAQVVNVLVQLDQPSAASQPRAQATPMKKVGRNDPCRAARARSTRSVAARCE